MKNKLTDFVAENKTFVFLLIGCLVLLALFVGVATGSGAWPRNNASGQILSALAGAAVAAIITLFLLLGQTASEEKKERNTKVFEERLRIYQEFLHKLAEVVSDMKIEPREEIELEFQVSYIAMHTSDESINIISEHVRDILINIKKGEKESNMILDQLFSIADVFHKELYGKDNDFKSEHRANTIDNFKSILVAKEDISIYEKALLIKSKIDPQGAKQWIWKGTTVVHEFFTDIDPKTGEYTKSTNMIAIDLQPVGNNYEINVFSRNNSEEKTKIIAEGIGETFTPNKDKSRHLFKRIPTTAPVEEIVVVMNDLLKRVREYRDKVYPPSRL